MSLYRGTYALILRSRYEARGLCILGLYINTKASIVIER